MEEKSLRGTLIEAIIYTSISNNIGASLNEMKEILQKELDFNLKFETIVNDIIFNDEYTISIGKIDYIDENGVSRVNMFTVESNSVKS